MNKRILIVTTLFASAIFASMILTANACTSSANRLCPDLPSRPVNMIVADGTDSYFITIFSGVPTGLDVKNAIQYPGWCIDIEHTMTRGASIEVTLYSSLNPPSSLSSVQWNKINYVLNNKQGTMDDVKEAIWYLAGQITYESMPWLAKVMVNEANLHPDFTPTAGQIVAVICYPTDSTQQISIIEVVCLECEYSCGGCGGYGGYQWNNHYGYGYQCGGYGGYQWNGWR